LAFQWYPPGYCVSITAYPTVEPFWNKTELDRQYRSAVSLDSHTNHSKESLRFIPEFTRKHPILHSNVAVSFRLLRFPASFLQTYRCFSCPEHFQFLAKPLVQFLGKFNPLHVALLPLLRSNSDVTASHFTLRHHNAARVKVCVRSRRLVLLLGADGRNIQVSTRIVIGRS
jgi:hypothetical protein